MRFASTLIPASRPMKTTSKTSVAKGGTTR